MIFTFTKKEVTELIEEYNKLPGKYFVNRSYFLYDRSNLIKNAYITALNKTLISVYGLFSYFKGKNANESLTKAYKFLIEKNSLRNELKFQLTNITGNIPKTKDNKIHNFSMTHLGRKRKLPLKEPIETIVVCPQQNFEIAGGLNSIQIELEDGRILNALKRYKNAMYKVTPLGLLFPASIKNDMKQVFITCIELNGVQKSIFNEKVYDHLAIIDVDKIYS